VLTVRPATIQDAEQLLLWRNETAARRWSRSQAEVSLAEHSRWLCEVLDSGRHLVLVAEADGQPVGSVRFAEQYADTWVVSMVLDPALRGRGLGRPCLTAAERMLLSGTVGTVGTVCARGGVTIEAVIHRDNPRSLQLFRACGYEPIPEAAAEDFLTYAKVVVQP